MEQPYIASVELCMPLPSDSYLNHIPAVEYLAKGNQLHFQKPVTFLVGENGTGKSTLIEAIAVNYGFNPEGGSKNFQFSTTASHSDLHQHLKLTRHRQAKDGFFLRAESFYNVASNIDELDRIPSFSPPIINSYGGVSLHEQSHGESFLSLVQNRLKGRGLYLFDEPESALSPMRLLTLLCEIDRLVKADSQLIIATHSPILMAYPNAEVLELSADGITSVDFQKTEHFKTTQAFFDNPQRMLKYLLKEER
ncbi:MAG: AAA family ATPase [Clostridia bacterium]|nr:AAA family ATPase [Clostridia bacterium]